MSSFESRHGQETSAAVTLCIFYQIYISYSRKKLLHHFTILFLSNRPARAIRKPNCCVLRLRISPDCALGKKFFQNLPDRLFPKRRSVVIRAGSCGLSYRLARCFAALRVSRFSLYPDRQPSFPVCCTSVLSCRSSTGRCRPLISSCII